MSESARSPVAPTELPVPEGPRLGIWAGGCLAITWLGSLILAWLPILLASAGLGLIALWCGVGYAFLSVGAFAAADAQFASWITAGLGLAGLSLFGAVLRRLLSPRGLRRAGPGGRFLRFLSRRALPRRVSLIDDLPDYWLVLVLAGLVSAAVTYLWRHPEGGLVSGTLLGASLALSSLYWVLLVLGQGLRIALFVYRFARSSEYRAGAVTALLFCIGSAAAGASAWLGEDAIAELPAPSEAGALLRQTVGTAPAATLRSALFGLSERSWPEAATREGVRHLLAPLLAETAHPSPSELSWVDSDGRLRFSQLGGAASVPAAPGAEWQACIAALYPAKVSRVKQLPAFGSQGLDDDTEHDLLLGAMLRSCTTHALRSQYADLPRVLERAVLSSALSVKQRRGREVIAHDPAAQMGQLCPLPAEHPDRRLAAEQELAGVGWRGLTALQKSILLEKAVLRYDDVEIAGHHPPLSAGQVKDAYQNSLNKLRSKLSEACPGPLAP